MHVLVLLSFCTAAFKPSRLFCIAVKFQKPWSVLQSLHVGMTVFQYSKNGLPKPSGL